MKIISWNVRKENPNSVRAMRKILINDPDVICLQEFPEIKLDALAKITKEYRMFKIYDAVNFKKRKRNSMYIVTLIKKNIELLEEHSVNYFSEEVDSILSRFLYIKVGKNDEKHDSLLLKIRYQDKEYYIMNLRLSCAVGAKDRVSQLEETIRSVPKTAPRIICGDLNIVDSKLYNRLTGWIRGFTKIDYKISERDTAENIFRKHNLVNVFKGKKTSKIPSFFLQFDHILTSKELKIKRHYMGRKTYGSDHRVLYLETQD